MEQKVIQEFMEITKCKNSSVSDREQKLPPPPLQLPYDSGVQSIALPSPDMFDDKEINFLELVELRTSVRNYRSAMALTAKELSYLLWCTQGVKVVMDDKVTLRTVPSAGARHAFETYLLINNVEGIDPGLYRFLALEHALLPVDTSDTVTQRVQAAFLQQKMLATCAVAFIWTAVSERMTYAYTERAYRYLHLDAGHVCQNLYLAAQTILCGACALGYFDDDQLNETLGIDGQRQFAIYAATVGH